MIQALSCCLAMVAMLRPCFDCHFKHKVRSATLHFTTRYPRRFGLSNMNQTFLVGRKLQSHVSNWSCILLLFRYRSYQFSFHPEKGSSLEENNYLRFRLPAYKINYWHPSWKGPKLLYKTNVLYRIVWPNIPLKQLFF